METKTTQFVDAQAMHLEYPDTFAAPSASDLRQLQFQDSVKVCPDTGSETERFWVTVESVDGETIIGIVDNDLVLTEKHGYAYGDKIQFEKRNVYDIFKH